jgi:hypothetical protein
MGAMVVHTNCLHCLILISCQNRWFGWLIRLQSVSAKATLNAMTITMSESQDTALKEVVVIGYGTRRKLTILLQSLL